jgi:putrescine transport system substrate-binding protein
MRRLLIAIATAAALVRSRRAQERGQYLQLVRLHRPEGARRSHQETGIKVVLRHVRLNDVLETKMLAGKSGYDVIVPSHTYLKRMIQAGVLQRLNKAKIPNLKFAWPEITGRLAGYDPGNEFSVNYMWGTTGIGFNVAKVKARIGNAPLNTWDMVFKPENFAKFRKCGIHMLDAADEMIPAALKYLGLDPDSKKPTEIEGGELLMRSAAASGNFIRPNTSTRWRRRNLLGGRLVRRHLSGRSRAKEAPRRPASRRWRSTTRCPRKARSYGSIVSPSPRTRSTSRRRTFSSTS